MNFNTYNKVHSSREEKNMNRQDIDKALAKWKNGLLKISKTYREGGDYKQLAHDFIKDMYAYDNSEVLF